MRKHLRLFLVFLGFVFILSCSSSKKPSNDSDIIPDADSDGSDAETLADDPNSQDSEIIDDSDKKPDIDNDSEPIDDSDEKPDVDNDSEPIETDGDCKEESDRKEASKVLCTGQKSCYSDDLISESTEEFEIECPAEGKELFGQDAYYDEVGSCREHSYSKSGDNTNGIVVKDEVTGLEWQQEISGTYTYEEALDYCENLEYGGFDDWRVPSMHELVSLIDLRCFESKCQNIDETYFPNTPKTFFWSSQKKMVSGKEPINAWGVYFWSGYTKAIYEGNHGAVRCVRGEPIYAASNFTPSVKNSNEIVTDKNSNLIWQKSHTMLTWKEALDYCENLEYAGYCDWRLPNRNELLSLIDYDKTEPMSSFPDMIPEIFWSSTTDLMFSYPDCADEDENCGPGDYENYAFCVDFEYGDSSYFTLRDKSGTNYVKCVR